MPKGHPIANMMHNVVVEFFYTWLKKVDVSMINFEEVAKSLGLKDAKSARQRMKVTINGKRNKAHGEMSADVQAKKQKRKFSEIESDGEEAGEGSRQVTAEQETGDGGSAIEAGENAV